MGWDFSDWRLRLMMACSVAISFLPFSLALAFTMGLMGIQIGLGAFFASEFLALAGAYLYLTLVEKGKES